MEELRQAEWKPSPKTDADAECEFRYQPDGWSKPYRFVALRYEKTREEMDAETERLCAAQVPGDTHRDLQVQSDYSGQTFKHILVPIWLLSYDYGARHFQVVINGYTGAIAGKYPKSWIKITLAVLGGLAAAAGILFFLAHAQH